MLPNNLQAIEAALAVGQAVLRAARAGLSQWQGSELQQSSWEREQVA